MPTRSQRVYHVWLSFGKELRESLRDRRTLAVMILFPLVIYPLLSLLAVQMAASRARTQRDRPSLVAVMGEAGAREAIAARLQQQPKVFTVLPQGDRVDLSTHRLDGLVMVDQARPAIAEIVYDGGRDESREAAERLSETVGSILPAGCSARFTVDKHNLARATEMGGYFLSKVLPLLLVLMVLLGAFYPAIDVTAGERERGTLETILSSPMRRFDLMLGKVLAVALLASLTGLLNLASMSATLMEAMRMADPHSAVPVPWTRAIAAASVIPPSAFLFASAFVAVGAVSRGFKEAQHLMTPVYLVCIAPAVAGAMGDYRLSGALAWIPCLNATLLARELLLGQASWSGVLGVLGATVTWGCAALTVAARIYSSERFLDLGPREPGRRAEPEQTTAGHAMFLFGVAFIMLYFVWMPLQRRQLELGLLASEWLGLFGLTVLFALATRRSLVDTLSIKRPALTGWLGAALIGLSAWAWVAMLSEWISPVPKDVLEHLRRSLIPTDGSRGLLGTLGLVALTPAICEEALFRGPILRGLRSRLGSLSAALVTGLLFGIFHVEISRILPTAVLGVLLSLIALQTGSILPAMLAHLLNNGVLVIQAYLGVDERVGTLGTGLSVLVLLTSLTLTGVGLGLMRKRSGPVQL
jgi:sodium transport system permease protein